MASIVHPSFTVDEYRRLIEARILAENRPIELIDAQLSEVPKAGGWHIRCSALLNRLFVPAIGDDAFLGPRLPLFIGERTVVLVDMAVLSGFQQIDSGSTGVRLVAEQLPAIDLAVADIFA